MTVLSIKDLQVNYDQNIVLKQVNFDVKQHEFIGIIGPNGGGKTTLVKTILGILKPQYGEIAINSSEIIGYVPQHTSFDRQFPITVKDVVLTGHLPKRIKLGQRFTEHEKQHALSIMKRLEILNLENRQIGTLSGGQMQRVLIARALMNHPTMLILDEPTSAVDEASKQEIYKLLKELNKTMTILMISHDTNELSKYVNRLFYINKTIHIHDYVEKVKNKKIDVNKCPIDWYIKGLDIAEFNANQINNNSDTKLLS